MKTIEEKIAVMQAFREGKEIQLRLLIDSKYYDCKNPGWNWDNYDYRVKGEPKQPEYIPFSFEDWEIMVDRIVKHKTKPIIEKLTSFFDDSVNAIFYNELLEEFTFLDGSPCGKLKQP